MTTPIKVLIPAAGRGTRLAAVSGGLPKELVRIGSLTMIEHCLAMVLDSGISDVAVVISPGKEAVREQLDRFWARRSHTLAQLTYFYQMQPRGVADAMRLAGGFAGQSPLAVVLPDHLLIGGPPALAQMISGFERTPRDTIGVIQLAPDRAGSFGNVGRIRLAPSTPGESARVRHLSPKQPGSMEASGDAPFFKGFTGVIYLPGWLDRIDSLKPNFQGEIDDTDLVLEMVRESRLWAVRLTGTGFDLGHPDGLAAARSALAAFPGATT